MPQQSPTRFNSSAPAPAGSWAPTCLSVVAARDRKSTRLNSSHSQISYAVFCLKKKKLLDLDALFYSLAPTMPYLSASRAYVAAMDSTVQAGDDSLPSPITGEVHAAGHLIVKLT